MAKLYFRYGAMSAAKSMSLLAVAHNYKKLGKRIYLMKPALENRFSSDSITSRSGLTAKADLLIKDSDRLSPGYFLYDNINAVLVDEAQFLSPEQVEDLRGLTLDPGIPVICYGLRTDFQTKLFPGSKRLLELADSIEEIKGMCSKCDRKSIINMRVDADGNAVLEGNQVQLGAEDCYTSVCYKHYKKAIGNA